MIKYFISLIKVSTDHSTFVWCEVNYKMYVVIDFRNLFWIGS